MEKCPTKQNISKRKKHADIQPGANKGGFAMLTTYISFSSLKSQTQPLLGVSVSNGVPQRPHDRGAGAERGRGKNREEEVWCSNELLKEINANHNHLMNRPAFEKKKHEYQLLDSYNSIG